jgi:hypothetical protein
VAFDEVKENLIATLLSECGDLTIGEALQFSSIPYDRLERLDEDDCCVIAKVIGKIAVKSLLDELGNDNKPLWLAVICYNIGNLESPHENHLCYGTIHNLQDEFRKIAKTMFLLSSIPAGQNHAYIKSMDDNEPSKDELKQQIIELHKNIIDNNKATPMLSIHWHEHKQICDLQNNMVVINAWGCLDDNSTDFDYQFSPSDEIWREYVEKIINASYGDLDFKDMLRTSIQAFSSTYPCTKPSPDLTELVCIFSPGNPYIGNNKSFVKDGVIICFDKHDETLLEKVNNWSKFVNDSLIQAIHNILAEPKHPENILPHGHDLKLFIKRLDDILDTDICELSLHNAATIYKIALSDHKDLQEIIKRRYPNFSQKVKKYLREYTNLDSTKNLLYSIAFINHRLSPDKPLICLGDMLAASEEAGWNINIDLETSNKLKESNHLIQKQFLLTKNSLKLFFEQLILIQKINNVIKVQTLSISQEKIRWILDLTMPCISQKNNVKQTYLDFAQSDEHHELHWMMRAIEYLVKLPICEYKLWNESPECIRISDSQSIPNVPNIPNILSYDLDASTIIENLRIVGIPDRLEKCRSSNCFTIMSNQKVRLIAMVEWSLFQEQG